MAFFARFLEPPKRSQSPAARPPVPPPAGAPVVTAISFTADSKFDTTVLGQYVSQRVGEPLSTRELQSSIKSLFDTGDFRDIRVDSKPTDGGVALTFSLFVNYRVAEVKFDGLSGADRDRATSELTLHVEDVLSLNAVDLGSVAVQSFLNRSGYLEATVDPETTFLRDQSRASVILHVTKGPRATVGTVLLEGNVAPFTAQELIAKMRRGPGKTLQVNDARLDADRIRNFLVRRNFRKADIHFLNYTYNKDTRQVVLRYRAITGPIVQVEVAGVPKRDVKGLIPFRKNQSYSEDAIKTASNDIVKNYQSRGYFNAAADAEEKLTGNVWLITFHVNPEMHYQLTAVTFSGNQKITDKQLAAVVTTSVSGGFRSLLSTILRRPTGVTRAQISSDRDAIESFYRLNGFSDVQVATPVVKTNLGGTMTIDFPIVEG